MTGRILGMCVAVAMLALGMPAPANADFCGGTKTWQALAATVAVSIADQELQQALTARERTQAARDIAALDTLTVGEAQIAAIVRLSWLAKAKLGTTASLTGDLYYMESVAWHVLSQHQGSLLLADQRA